MAVKDSKSKCPLEESKFERTNPDTGLSEEYNALGSQGNLDPLWIEAMEMLDSDLHWLLQLDHHRFWCQALHDKSLHKALNSYLQLAPRSCDKVPVLPLRIQELMRDIHRHVFMVLLRMSTHKESSVHFISPKVFGRLIYEYFLFDIPKLMDICVLYGEANKPLVTKMMANIFEKQPKYEADWDVTLKIVLGTLTEISSHVTRGLEGGAALKLNTSSRLSSSEFSDVVLQLGDFLVTLHHFVEIYPHSALGLGAAGFMERVISFYESTVTKLQENWHLLKSSIPDWDYIKTRLRLLKRDLVWLVHKLLLVCFLSPQTPDSSGVKSKEDLDAFFSVVSDIASEKNFLKEYKKQFDLAEDVKIAQKIHPEIPETHFDYILSAAMVEEDEVAAAPTAAVAKSKAEASSASDPTAVIATPLSKEAEAAVSQSLVSQVKDLFPHLEEDFIKLCLKEFANNPETVINHILEENLPPHLFLSHTEEVPSLLDQRENVYDNDEFDVFRKPEKVDLSRVHIGKKYDATTAASLLDDKSSIQETRERYKSYVIETPQDYISEEMALMVDHEGGETDKVWTTGGFDALYNDEYDDTYDSHNVGAADDATDEQFTVKRLNRKGALFGRLSDDDGDGMSSQTSVVADGGFDTAGFGRKTVPPAHGGWGKGGRAPEGRKGQRSKGVAEGRTIREDGGRLLREREGAMWRDSERKWLSVKPSKDHSRQNEDIIVQGKEPERSKYTILSKQEGRSSNPPHVEEDKRQRDGPPRGVKGQTEAKVHGSAMGERKGHNSVSEDERRARQVKDRHKSSRANHGRKALADKKRRGGML